MTTRVPSKAKEMVKAYQRAGWVMDSVGKGGKVLMISPNGERARLHGTVSDPRSNKNQLAVLRRWQRSQADAPTRAGGSS